MSPILFIPDLNRFFCSLSFLKTKLQKTLSKRGFYFYHSFCVLSIRARLQEFLFNYKNVVTILAEKRTQFHQKKKVLMRKKNVTGPLCEQLSLCSSCYKIKNKLAADINLNHGNPRS